WSWFQSWDEVNPNHYQLLWNDEDSDRFVRGTFNEKISEAYFRLPRVVLRADLTRYLMLYALGGVYTDMDTSCHVPIEKWFQGQKGVNVIVGVEHNFGDKDSTNQWTIVSSPRHDFMQLVIQRVVTVILESSVEFLSDKENILDITGPGIFKRVVWDYVRDVKKGNLRDMANLHHGFTLYGENTF
ncbi:membrane-bound alpha-1,6- mannosyltransferase Initiation-specific, partial [Rhizoclosmatium hyalinum]